MKKFLPVILLGILLVFTACGSGSSEKADKDTQTVIDNIIEFNTKIDNKSLEDGQKPYKYTEKDFSFLIYKDKDTKRYIVDSWVPVEGESNSLESFYKVDEDKKFNSVFDEYDFKDEKASGNYELVYKSGNFKE
ncbi:hypothetical protein EY695_02480 [Enterococcus faecalis]|uniref:hypothetical protein n=1 Tax=Enterococcus faecalis TaxID=1351 RepID=UPI001AD674DB|nr:hypothetical protein [Enterococcus faecalis]MBO6342248.1 hypothetical protein [Enterococcus faecalis]MBO6361320.1 hypothetical protein [Enterococcus faecalis]